jgi:hypothetical protein
LALEMGIRAQTSIRGVILVVGVLKPWHLRWVLGLKPVSEVIFLWEVYNTSDTGLSPNTHLTCQGFKTPTTRITPLTLV